MHLNFRNIAYALLVVSEVAITAICAIAATYLIYTFRHGASTDDMGFGKLFLILGFILLGVALWKLTAAIGVLRKNRWGWVCGFAGSLTIAGFAVWFNLHESSLNWFTPATITSVALYLLNRPSTWKGSGDSSRSAPGAAASA